MYIYTYIYIYIYIYIYFKQTIVNDLWLHNCQQNKTKTNKQTNKIFAMVGGGT